jgi:hypothetical protein
MSWRNQKKVRCCSTLFDIIQHSPLRLPQTHLTVGNTLIHVGEPVITTNARTHNVWVHAAADVAVIRIRIDYQRYEKKKKKERAKIHGVVLFFNNALCVFPTSEKPFL